jgi:hypothetical protein
MGDGCINIREISDWVDSAGFTGHREVEIFSTKYWAMDQVEWLGKITEAYQQLYDTTNATSASR